MKDKKNKRFREIKKSHSWIAILLFILIEIIVVCVIAAYFNSFLFYIMDSKITDEYDDASYMAKLYSRSVRSGNGDVYGLLDESGRSYILKDDNGSTVHHRGEDTMSDRGGIIVLNLPVFSQNIKVFLDNDSTALYINDNGNISINALEVLADVRKYSSSDVIDMMDDDDEDDYDEDDPAAALHIGVNTGFRMAADISENIDVLYFPFWIAEDVSGGTLYVKSFISFNTRDILLFGSFVVVIGVIMLVIFGLMIANVISGAVRRQRTLKVFFSDVVTRGHNWMWLIIRGQQLLTKRKTYSSRFAVISIVFVNYRNFCVCHSIEEGEKLLCAVYNIIKDRIGKNEMCAHYTSANFAVLMKFTDEEQLKQRVQDLISELEKINEGHKFAFHAGIYFIEPDGTPDKNGTPVRRRDLDLESAYNNACTARATLEASDDSGIAFFDAKLVDDQKWIDIVQEHQQTALENEEFMVYYQPKYDPRTDELRGAEALIRWQSPEFGFVPPGKIIPIYEKNGFITEIDHYMITHVARDQKHWLDEGRKCVPVSVNVSRAHFIESDLAEQIRDMVDKEGAPHDLIEIELTESAFFDDKKAMISTITKLKSYGFAVSMDDFGSGYSSLNSLKDMPLDVLKLDAEFFRGENGGGRGEIVVSEAIKLAKSLNMRTVAEGVEVRDQVDFLAAQGCDMIQGYYYAKPMPRNEYEQRMRSAEAAGTAPEVSEPAAAPETPAVSEAPAAPEAPAPEV